MSKNSNNGNWKKRHERLMEEFDKLRQAYEMETGTVWFGYYEYPVGQSKNVVNSLEDAIKIINGDM